MCANRWHFIFDDGELPEFVDEGDYEVRINWDNSQQFIQFHVPACSNIFDKTVGAHQKAGIIGP